MRANGFTLIEVMIVLVIIGVMSAIATMSINAPSYSRFLASAEKLTATFSILSDDAIYTSSVIACSLGTDSIKCSRYRDGEWQDLNLKKILSWSWPDNMVIKRVLINGNPIREKQLVKFLPSGDNDSLSVEVSNGEFTSWIDSDLTGKYKVSN